MGACGCGSSSRATQRCSRSACPTLCPQRRGGPPPHATLSSSCAAHLPALLGPCRPWSRTGPSPCHPSRPSAPPAHPRTHPRCRPAGKQWSRPTCRARAPHNAPQHTPAPPTPAPTSMPHTTLQRSPPAPLDPCAWQAMGAPPHLVRHKLPHDDAGKVVVHYGHRHRVLRRTAQRPAHFRLPRAVRTRTHTHTAALGGVRRRGWWSTAAHRARRWMQSSTPRAAVPPAAASAVCCAPHPLHTQPATRPPPPPCKCIKPSPDLDPDPDPDKPPPSPTCASSTSPLRTMRCTVKLTSGSLISSSIIFTEIVLCAWPGSNTSTPCAR